MDEFLDRGHVTDTAPDLYPNPLTFRSNPSDRIGVLRAAFESTVQVDDVEPSCAGPDPSSGHFKGTTVDCGFLPSALSEPDCISLIDVDGRVVALFRHLERRFCAEGR